MPGHLQVAQAEQRLAVDLLQAGHAGERHFQGNGDLPLDLLGGGAGEQRDHFDDRRRRVGIGLDVDVQEGEDADHREEDGEQDDDQRIVERPGDELANHGNLLSVVTGSFDESRGNREFINPLIRRATSFVRSNNPA